MSLVPRSLIDPSLAIHRTFAYLVPMFARRLVSGVMTLMAVQFAGVGVQPLCAGDHHSAPIADAAGEMAHDGPMSHGATEPCAPTSPDSGAPHTPMSCLAMAGCAAAGIAGVIAPDVIASPLTVSPFANVPANLHSINSPPETPPPIA